MLKKIGIFLLSVICVGEVNAQKSSGAFSIQGEMVGVKGGVAKLLSLPPSNELIDSCVIEGSKFTLKGNVDVPTEYFMVFENVTPSEVGQFVRMVRVFVEPTDIKFSCDIKNIQKTIVFENAPIHNEVNEYFNFIKTIPQYKESKKISSQIGEAFKVADMNLVKKLSEERSVLNMQVIDAIMIFKKDAKQSIAAAYHVAQQADALSLDDKVKVVALFDNNFKISNSLNELKDYIAQESLITIGKIAPNFEVKDVNGKSYTLKDFKGKYVFLEFSASWCGWCKKEIPFVRKAYNALKDKNIVFITMNMDTTREKWVNDIKEENIEWFCFSNLEGMGSKLSKSYNLHGIPACFVISPEGKIVARDLRGDNVLIELSKLVQ